MTWNFHTKGKLEYSYCIRAIGSERALFFYDARLKMGLMHNYVIQCMRVSLGGIAKQVPPFFREFVFHFYILATNIRL